MNTCEIFAPKRRNFRKAEQEVDIPSQLRQHGVVNSMFQKTVSFEPNKNNTQLTMFTTSLTTASSFSKHY